MKISYQAVLLSAMALFLGACSEDNPWMNDGEGGISLRLSPSAEVKDAIPMLRGDAPMLEAPDAADFSISLTNLSTDEVKTWATLSDFNNQKSFATGQYTLTAFYGDPDEEGFNKPYFTGTADVTVLEARESTVEVTAQLANSMVSIDYTDAFRGYFKDYGVTIHSEGHSYVEFAADETRPAFIAPGEVSLAVSVTNPSGKTATIQPASFPAMARYHYHITLDVNTPPTGDAQLQIIFDDSLTQEDVTIDLTDELFSSPAPKVAPTGFTDGQTLELLSGSSASSPLKFDVTAYGGIKSALLTISGDGLTPAFGNEVELVNASALTQSQLADMGIRAVGFFKNPSNLASLDVSGLASHLPDGKFAVSLVVKDAFTRVSEPVTLNISTEPVVVNASEGVAVFKSNQASINVSYNGSEPEKNVSFKALANTGVYKDCEILSVSESTRTRSFDVKDYIFTIALPDTDRDQIPVRIYFGGVEKSTINVEVTVPQYDVEFDAFASYAKMQIKPANSSDMAAITNCLKLFKNGSPVSEESIRRSPETGLITILNLSPASTITLAESLTATSASTARQHSVTTEVAAAIPNGDFSQSEQTINISGVQVGGNYSGTIFNGNYHYLSSIVRSTPTGWATVNPKTCYTGSSNTNTWFLVPSTYVENGAAILRNVGYDHAGTTPGTTKETAVYYCKNTPTFANANKCAGELFLGSYSFDGSEHRVDGISFNSRPLSMTFDYSYAAQNGESAKVEISLLDASGNVIASANDNLSAASSMTSHTVNLPGYGFGKKAASIRVRFVSSTAAVPYITVPTGDALNEYKLNGIGNGLKNNTLSANTYHAYAAGSVLTVDNVKLNY